MPLSQTFVECLKDDRQLLEQAHPTSEADAQQTIRTLAAWMQWVLIIDESLGKLHPQTYGHQRDTDAGGRAIHGLRYAWERLKHQGHRLDELVLTVIGADHAIVSVATNPPRSRPVPAAEWQVRWKDFAELPEPDPKFMEPGPLKPKEDGYKQYLSEQPVIASTAPIQTFLLDHV